MTATTIVRKDNKKGKAVLKHIRNRKAELRAFLAAGGKIEDFNPKEKSFA